MDNIINVIFGALVKLLNSIQYLKCWYYRSRGIKCHISIDRKFGEVYCYKDNL